MRLRDYESQGLSSIKGISDSYEFHKNFDSSVKDTYKVNVISLDTYLHDHSDIQNIILKVDTQGSEMEVLRGAKNAFETGKIKAVIIEATTLKKYNFSETYINIFEYLHSFKFKLFDLYPFYYEKDGAMSEFDCVFVKDY